MSRKIVILFSILVIASMLLVSCAPAATETTSAKPEEKEEAKAEEAAPAEEEEAAPAEKIKLTVEMSIYVEAPHKKAFDMLKEAYEKENPNIEIEYVGADYADFWGKLKTEVLAGTEGDIVQMNGTTNYATYAALRPGETGAFVNLDDYIAGTTLEEDLVDQDSLTYNGHYIGLSNYAWGIRAIYYRKSLFQEAGIDPASIKTTDDFLEAARKLTKKGENGAPDQYGFGAVLSTHSFVWDEMKTFACYPIGGTYFANGNAAPYEADNIIVNGPEMNACFKWWQDMIFKEEVVAFGSYDKAQERDLFWNGTVAMNIDGPWFVGMTREKDPALYDDLGVIASPSVVYNGETYPFYGEYVNISHAISSESEHPEEAWKFLEWMASPEAQEIIAVCGMIPTLKSYNTSAEYAELIPINAELVKLANENYKFPAVIDPNIPELGEMSQIMVEAAQAAFITNADVGETLDTAAEQMKDIFQ